MEPTSIGAGVLRLAASAYACCAMKAPHIRWLPRSLYRSHLQLCDRYGIDSKILRQWRRLRRDRFPAPIKVGSGWFYPLSGVLTWERPRSRLRGLFLGRPR
jgi:hypothetical protein